MGRVLLQALSLCCLQYLAGTNSTVLITGKTGTGNELVDRAIHRNSLRGHKPIIAINCAAVTETLLESELFGHERGAFTGADKARGGLFEAPHEGKLSLDEVAEMSAAAQAKLLRVLSSGEIQRVGLTVTRKVDVRVLAVYDGSFEAHMAQQNRTFADQTAAFPDEPGLYDLARALRRLT
jgi:transcriptional regulator with GAF, ATPase, and Fis domain